MVEFPAGERTASAYLASPAGGRGPGVLVMHAWWGLNDFFKGLCDRLAGEGFTVLAPDLYGGQVATTIEEATTLSKSLDEQATMAMVQGAIDFLRSHPAVRGDRLGAIGFSMGGYWVVLLSTLRPEAFGAVVVFYGAGEGDFGQARAAYLAHFCEEDEWEPREWVEKMEADMHSAGREATFHYYSGVKHWFFEADRLEHDPAAAELAWERTVEFLKEQLEMQVNLPD
jgi:carboxymethylenebutenolidase